MPVVMVLFTHVGMEKVNFSGGEPFIHQKGKYVGELVRYCKEDLSLPSVSIVSNGSLIDEEWFQEYGEDITKLWPKMTLISVFSSACYIASYPGRGEKSGLVPFACACVNFSVYLQ